MLENKIKIDISSRSLPVSSVDIKKTACVVRHKKKAHALTVLTTYDNAVGKSNKVVVSKCTLSWAVPMGTNDDKASS
jgi:hypothetical protein